MASVARALRPVSSCARCSRDKLRSSVALRTSVRSFASTRCRNDAQVEQSEPALKLDPNTVVRPRDERELMKAGIAPIGSRRRRAALRGSQQLPFEQLPFQCFQEARKILQADRDEKIKQINVERDRLTRLRAQDAAVSGGEQAKQRRVVSMEQYIEKLKILADINDPLVKKRFEDGVGDMNRPIYRHLADKKWRLYRRRILMQRIEQMHVVPDVLMKIDPIYDVTLAFGRKSVPPGEFVASSVSESLPSMNVQVFDRGERLVTVVVVDSDVPNFEKDGFDYRLHYMATNITISPTSPSVSLSSLSKDDQEIFPWLPPIAQKGSPYHRLSVFVFKHDAGQRMDPAAVQRAHRRDGFKLRSFLDKFPPLRPVGVTLFRTAWDESMAEVMRRAGIGGAELELKRKRIEPLPYKRKDGERFR